MKNVILILFIALVSCSGSDDTPPTNIDENLIGKWSLTNYGKWPQGNFGYDNDEIIWEFQQNGTLTITISETAELHPDMYFQTSGIYECSTWVSGQSNEYNNLTISSMPDTLGYRFGLNGELYLVHEDPTDGNSYWYDFERID